MFYWFCIHRFWVGIGLGFFMGLGFAAALIYIDIGRLEHKLKG